MRHHFPWITCLIVASVAGLTILFAAEPAPSKDPILAGFNLDTREQLPAGRYLFISINPETAEITPTLIDLGGDGPVPPPPPPPPPEDLAKQIDALIAKVTGDPEKAETAGQVAQIYGGLVASVDSGVITESDTLRKAAGVVPDVLGLLGKGDEWKPFTDGIRNLLAGCSDLPKCRQVLQVAAERLREIK